MLSIFFLVLVISPNYLVIRSDGAIYFSNDPQKEQPDHAVYCIINNKVKKVAPERPANSKN